jgi:hypothetical protein
MNIQPNQINFKKLAAIPAGLIVLILVIYIIRAFFDAQLGDSGSWGEFGDFFGGVLNPVLSTATFFALLYTIHIQMQQLKMSDEALKISQEELKLSTAELAKSSAAQHETQLALNKQANIAVKASKLDSVSFLIKIYQDEFNDLTGNDGRSLMRRQILINKLRLLNNFIEATYEELVWDQKNKDGQRN